MPTYNYLGKTYTEEDIYNKQPQFRKLYEEAKLKVAQGNENFRTNLLYYAPGGKEFEDARRDYEIGIARQIAPSLGITLEQLMANPSLYTDQSALAGYKAINENKLPTPQFQTFFPSTGITYNDKGIPISSIKGGQGLVNLPSGLTDTTNYSGILGAMGTGTTGTATAMEMPSWLKSYLDTSQKPTNPADILTGLESKYGIDEKTKLVNDLTQQLNVIQSEAQQATLGLEQQAGGRDITQTFLGRQQQEVSRQSAIKALPVQAQLLAAQGNLELAQDRVNTYYKIQSDYETQLYNYNKDLRDKVYSWASDMQKEILNQQQRAEDRAFTLLRDNLNYGQSLSNTAFANGQSSLGAQIMALNPKDPNYTTKLAGLAGQIRPKPTTPSAPKVKNINDILYSVGLPNQSVSDKGQITDANLTKLQKVGIPPRDAQEIMNEILSGKTLEEIRQWMRKNGVDPIVLDKFMTALQGIGGTEGSSELDKLFNNL